MHAAPWRSLCAARLYHRAPAGRIIAGARRPLAREFHPSRAFLQVPAETEGAATGDSKDDSTKSDATEEETVVAEGETATSAENSTQSFDVSQRAGRRPGYGSAVRRASRNKAAIGLPPLEFPNWFWDKNVVCYGEPEDVTQRVGIKYSTEAIKDYKTTGSNVLLSLNTDDVAVLNMQAINKLEIEIQLFESRMKEFESVIKRLEDEEINDERRHHVAEGGEAYADQPLEIAYNEKSIEDSVSLLRSVALRRKLQVLAESNDELRVKDPNYWYSISENVYNEIYMSFCGELRLQPPNINIKDVHKRDTLLVCPVEGGIDFLNGVVTKVATALEADVVRLDTEDIAQILGEYFGEDVAWSNNMTAVLGYGRHGRADGAESSITRNEIDEEEDEIDSDDIEDTQTEHNLTGKESPLPVSLAFLESPSRFLRGLGSTGTKYLAEIFEQSNDSSPSRIKSGKPGENWNDYKTVQAMERIIGAPDAKRARSMEITSGCEYPGYVNSRGSKGLIIQINGYKELYDHPLGHNLLKCLREAVKKCWYGGRNVMIVGAIAEKLDRSLIRVLDPYGDKFSMGVAFDKPITIFAPPECHRSRIEDDRKAQVRNLNIRHTEYMTKKLLGADHDSQWKIDINLDSIIGSKMGRLIDKTVWSYHDVRRIATAMLATVGSDKIVDGANLAQVLSILHPSDIAKSLRPRKGDTTEDSMKRIDEDVMDDTSSKIRKHTVETEDKLDKLKKQCTVHERKLLGGVINASDIQTTFADIRAPPESIEALKTLTSLSLLRPDSFSYGVLASDKIPGLLLYGPPGTGKTLLAKAVAKESGATMLEVSASEINDMYVGESEKNVKALFSLAKKLSPCVVFIDEADSLFGSRGNDFQRRSHRETINQFLREWDGMANLSTFIMVATNRPFDLDEAVLRRLPRRLLVDLPGEKDREAILEIHLRGEILDKSISLATLAKNTPFYSGSDLKNLSVAAALACVREENDIAASYNGEEPYIYPPRRVLRKLHFDKAMEEISASISEDMSTLSAIRKFDERYGDRKGRRKMKSGMGFGGTSEPEQDSGAGRVRKLELAV